MSWLGKMLGGSLGFVFGGPLGAILGATLGHHALDSGRSMSSMKIGRPFFFLATFSMLGKLSKADGRGVLGRDKSRRAIDGSEFKALQ